MGVSGCWAGIPRADVRGPLPLRIPLPVDVGWPGRAKAAQTSPLRYRRNTLDGARPVHSVDSVRPIGVPVGVQLGLEFRPNYDVRLRGWTAGARAFGDTDMGSVRPVVAPRLRFRLSGLRLHEIRSVVAWKPAPTSIGKTDLPWVRDRSRPPRQLEDVTPAMQGRYLHGAQWGIERVAALPLARADRLVRPSRAR